MGALYKEGPVSIPQGANRQELGGAIGGLRSYQPARFAVRSLIAPLLNVTEGTFIWKCFARDLENISSGFYRWVDGLWAYLSEDREKSSPVHWTEGCEWENGPSVTLRWSIFTHRSQRWIPLFWLVTRSVCTLDYCTCWLTDKRRQWKCNGLGQRPALAPNR